MGETSNESDVAKLSGGKSIETRTYATKYEFKISESHHLNDKFLLSR